MFKSFRPLLIPFFRLAASPGIGNPHTPYEEELMLAGVKPVAIIDGKGISTELQAAIDKNHITHISTQKFENKHRIYCKADDLDMTRQACGIINNAWSTHKLPTKDELSFLSTVFNLDAEKEPSYYDVMPKLRQAVYNHIDVIYSGISPLDSILRMNNASSIFLPIKYVENFTVDSELEEYTKRNNLKFVEFSDPQSIFVLAQSDKIEEGKELSSRYYNEGEGYSELNGRELNSRIGELLGYTKNDIAWSNATKYHNPLIKKFMYSTMEWRSKARKAVMLYDSARLKP